MPNNKMKAILFWRYGTPEESFKIKEIRKPEPGDDEVLIKIYATTVTSGVSIIRKAPFIVRLINGPFKPLFWKILGIEFSGMVHDVGKNVALFKKGDEVFGTAGFGMGTYAEYKCLSEKKAIVKKPSNLTWEEAAALPVGAYTALYFLKGKGNIHDGQKVLVYGASGSVGTYAIQLAKYFNTEVTGVCSTNNLELVKSLSADHVIDYKQENYQKEYGKYDIIFDAVGKISADKTKKYLKPGGKYLTVAEGLARGKAEDLLFIKELAESGKLKVVIDHVYRFEEIAAAFRHVEGGHKKGNVVVKVVENSN